MSLNFNVLSNIMVVPLPSSFSFFKDVNEQVAEVCDFIANDPQLANGYHAVGFSQVRTC